MLPARKGPGSGDRRSLVALRASLAHKALIALIALAALRASRSLPALKSLRTLDPLNTLVALRSGNADRRALIALGPLRPQDALCALWSLVADGPDGGVDLAVGGFYGHRPHAGGDGGGLGNLDGIRISLGWEGMPL